MHKVLAACCEFFISEEFTYVNINLKYRTKLLFCVAIIVYYHWINCT